MILRAKRRRLRRIPANIERIILDKPEESYNNMKLVKICFKFPCNYTYLNIIELLQIIRLWIKGEEEKYPLGYGFKGRWLLFEEIKKIFEEVGTE